MNILKKFIFLCFFISTLLLTFHKEVFSQTGWSQQIFSNNDCTGINFPSKDTGYIYQYNGDPFKSIDGGHTWSNIFPNTTDARKGKFETPLLGFVFGVPIKLTTDGCLTWRVVSNTFPSIGSGFFADGQFVNSEIGYMAVLDLYPIPIPCCYDGVIYKTTNSGENWNEVYRAGGIQFQEVYFKNEISGIILDNGALVSTSDGGQNWYRNNRIIYDTRYFSSRSMTNPFKDTIYIAGIKRHGGADTGAVIKSTDNGNSWFFTLQMSIRSSLRKIFFLDNNYGYAVGDTGLIVKTTNGGENWSVLNSGTRKRLNGVSFINRDTGFVVGDSGLVLTTFTGGLVGVSNELSVIPDKFILHQNYPNPFNPETIIRYQLSVYSDVSLKVFDVLGNEVAELVNIKQPAGSYSVEFDAGELPSGIYFYRLDAGNFSQVKKMMVLK